MLALGKAISGIFTVTTVSFTTWGAIEANNTHNKHKYKQKMEEYGKWRDEFYEKGLYDTTYMCPFSDIEKCLNNPKDYLPKPNEDKLWIKAYKGLSSNSESTSNLSEIKTPEQLKDYCYKEVYKSIKKYKSGEDDEKKYFQANQKHYWCVLTQQQLSE